MDFRRDMKTWYKSNVSIVMPVYNEEAVLQRAISSIIDQKYINWELIIVDDGSKDKSLEIAKEFEKKDKRIKVLHQENRGVSEARNYGLTMASGEWIWFVDSDDQVSEDFLEKVFSKPISSKIDLIVGNFDKVSGDSNDGEEVKLFETGEFIDISELFMKYQYVNGFWGYLWNKLIRRSLIEHNKFFFQKGLSLAEDLKFMIFVYQKCNHILLEPVIAMHYRIGNSEKSYNQNINYNEQVKIQLEIYEWIVVKNGKKKYERFLKSKISAYAAYIVFYTYERKQDYKTAIYSIYQWKELYSLLSCRGANNVMRPIIYCLIHKANIRLDIYLVTRRILREIYRNIKYKDSRKK